MTKYVYRFLEPFRPRLTPKFSNSANMINKSFFANAKKVISEKLKKWQKNGVFDFSYCMQKFSAYYFWVILFAFFQQIGTQHRILRFMIPIPKFLENIFWLLILANCTLVDIHVFLFKKISDLGAL